MGKNSLLNGIAIANVCRHIQAIYHLTLSRQLPRLNLQSKICDVSVSPTAESIKFRVDFHCFGAKNTYGFTQISLRRRSLACLAFVLSLPVLSYNTWCIYVIQLYKIWLFQMCLCITIPDVIQALLPIVESEGPLLTAGWAQISTRTVGLSLYPQLQPVERHWERDKRIDD